MTRFLLKRLDTNTYQTVNGDVWGTFDESYGWHSEPLAKAEAADLTKILGVDVVVVNMADEKKLQR